MDHFLIYIVISSLVTLVSIMFAYKPEEDELALIELNKNELEGRSIESAPIYSKIPNENDVNQTSGLKATLTI